MKFPATPLVGLPADSFEKSGLLFHSVGDKYLTAVAEVSKCLPIMIPSMGDMVNWDELLDHLDGVVMTGAISNVHPPHYGEEPSTDHEPYDHVRDRTTLKLLRRVVDRGMPLFCICRGFQELNVALGGTLEAELQRGEGRLDHRGEKSDDTDLRYKLAHRIDVVAGSMLERILGKREAMVNSVHRQGIRRLAASLAAEALAPDGVIEAVSIKGAKGFAFGTQWHPEYKAAQNPDSVKLFEAFGDAVRAYHLAKMASAKVPLRSATG